MNDQHDLALVMRSHFSVIRIDTHEEKRAIGLLANTAKAEKDNGNSGWCPQIRPELHEQQ